MEDNKDKITQLFMLLIGSYEMAALQQMGKIKNPLTNQVERNLEQARFSIDLLDMLREKTKGNLGEYEQKYLDNAIAQLKLNYVDEVEKDKKNPPAEQNAPPEEQAAP
jgi:PIN domain nuclease of toxin-antitoxin system